MNLLLNANSATVTAGGTTSSSGDTALTVTTAAAFPTYVAGQQFTIIDAVDIGKTANYEIMQVTAWASGTSVSWTVVRGAEGTTVKTHAANWVAVPAPTSASLLPGAYAFGTVTTSTVNMPSGYSVYTATLTASDNTPFVLPHAVGGENYLLRLTNPSGTFAAPTIAAFSGDTLNWVTGLPYWLTTAGAINEMGFVAAAASTVDGFALTGWPLVTSQITQSGSLQSGSGGGTTYTISVTTQPVGTLLVLSQLNYPISTVTAVTTGGTGTTAAWGKIDGTSDSTLNESIDLWMTTVTGVGAMVITVSAPHGGYGYIQPFTTTVANPVWTLDVHGNVDGSTATTTALFPTLTPTPPNVNELYVGAYTNAANAVGLTTAGYVNLDPLIYALNVSTVQAPQGTQASGQYVTAAGLILLT